MKKLNQENLDKINKVISIILLVFWCLLIFYFSNQVGSVSRDSSSRIVNILNKIFNVNLYNYKYSVFIVRKCAHMFLYFILFLLSLNVCCCFKIKKYYLYSILFCLIYASFDEIHQLFIVERSFRVTDIIIDIMGSSISLGIVKLITRK